MKVGERYRVKATTVNRVYGVRCYRSVHGEADNYLFPGDIGTVVERKWTSSDGSENSGLWLEFTRGRQLSVTSADAADFVRVRGPSSRVEK